jgi:hypothetical protein
MDQFLSSKPFFFEEAFGSTIFYLNIGCKLVKYIKKKNILEVSYKNINYFGLWPLMEVEPPFAQNYC